MAGTQIATRDELRAYIAAGGTYAGALSGLLETEDNKTVAKKKRSTIASRKTELAKAVADFDVEVLSDIQERMQNYIDNMKRDIDVNVEQPRELTPQEVLELMVEHQDFQKINEFLAMRREAIRTLVFMSIDEANRAKGLDPMVTGGQLAVAEVGKRFCKEGAGYAPPGLDENALRLALGEEDAAKVFETKVIPAKEVSVLSEEKLMQLAQEKPEVMETIRGALIPSKVKSAKFQVRDYEA